MERLKNRSRPPAVAGMFYPAEVKTLKREIHRFLDNASAEFSNSEHRIKALIVPHAGYIYSGPIAASAYKQLIPYQHLIKRVVLLGPCHRVAINGMALPGSSHFRTPLGEIPIDQPAIATLSGLSQITISDEAHREEHSLEVQLPFLQETLDDFSLVPIVVGDASMQQVSEVINLLWGDEQTLIVISTDLSHYHDYYQAKQLDRATSDAIENLRPELIRYEDACGRNGLTGMLTATQQHQLTIQTLDLRNSGDTAGSKDSVVGYGAYVIH
ncbi:MAG: AmmeMemoRadiSam system protein B [Gammaproteobacteria bacterium]|nr:AmmeMemoRadiSam system protein B [Gammaproteobacteria bacterium]